MNSVLLKIAGEKTGLKIKNNETAFESTVCALLFFLDNIDNIITSNGEFAGTSLKNLIKKELYSTLGEKGRLSELFSNEYKGLSENEIEEIYEGENDADRITLYPFGIVRSLLEKDNFSACHLSFNGKTGLYEKDSFMLLYVVDGECLLTDYDSSTRLNAGDSVYIPADFRTEITGGGNVIIVHS